jgi:uncharacterized membrane protein YedE/YeeE
MTGRSRSARFRHAFLPGSGTPRKGTIGIEPGTADGLVGEAAVLAAGGLLVGSFFGAFAQLSRFCLRSAVIEFSSGLLGSRIAIWLLTFSAAVVTTQASIGLGLLDIDGVRQLAARGSLSGSIIGGLLFGAGMILARGCASRLLVLSATGNLRALVSGLLLTVVAQASLRGALSPAREALSNLWTVEGEASRSPLSLLNAEPALGACLGAAGLGLDLWLARRARIGVLIVASALGVGLTIAAGWLFTFRISQVSFAGPQVKSISFTGPSADGPDQFTVHAAGIRYRAGPGFLCRFDARGLDGPRMEGSGISRRPQHGALSAWRVIDGLWRYARWRMCRWSGCHRRGYLFIDSMGRAGCHVGGSACDAPTC